MKMNMFRTLVGGAACAGLLAVATPNTASAQVGFVAQASYAVDGVEELAIGGGVNFGIGSLTEKYGIKLETTFDYFLMDDPATFWQINSNLLYDLKSVPNLYLGAGVNYSRFSLDGGEVCIGPFCEDFGGGSSSDVGLNILGGYKLGAGKLAPFVQARFELGGGEQFVVTGGIRF